MPASSTAFSDARALPSPSWSPLALLCSVTPALDRAFGLDVDPDLPDALAALVARLQGTSDAGFGEAEAAPVLAPMPVGALPVAA